MSWHSTLVKPSRRTSPQFVEAIHSSVTVSTRADDLYELGGGLTWEFGDGWSLNPEILYIEDNSNILTVNYSSTEIWLTLRYDF